MLAGVRGAAASGHNPSETPCSIRAATYTADGVPWSRAGHIVERDTSAWLDADSSRDVGSNKLEEPAGARADLEEGRTSVSQRRHPARHARARPRAWPLAAALQTAAGTRWRRTGAAPVGRPR